MYSERKINMLSTATAQLVEEVFGSISEKARKKAQQDPEVCLISLLTVIKKHLPHVYTTLRTTVEMAPYDDYLKEARQKLKQTA